MGGNGMKKTGIILDMGKHLLGFGDIIDPIDKLVPLPTEKACTKRMKKE